MKLPLRQGLCLLLLTGWACGQPPVPDPDGVGRGIDYLGWLGGPPAARQGWFVDRAAESGLDWSWQRTVVAEDRWDDMFGAGAAVADFDGDGWVDVLLTAHAGGLWLHRNLDGLRFAPVPLSLPVPDRLNGASAADIDNDGDVDLMLLVDGADQLWRNDGDWRFTDISDEVGPLSSERTVAASWQDFDGDGLLDLYSCSYLRPVADDPLRQPAPDLALRNTGAGAWETIPIETELPNSACFSAGLVDFRGTGEVALLTVHDKGNLSQLSPNRMLRYRDGRLVDEAAEVGLDVRIEGMGLGIADLDNDGDEDVWKSALWTNYLFLNSDAEAVEAALASGVDDPQDEEFVYWDVEPWDFDHDGDLDVMVAASGWEGAFTLQQSDRFFVAATPGRFADQAEELGLSAVNRSRMIARADFDRDGVMDLLLPQADGRLFLYQGGDSELGSITVELVGRGLGGSNRQGVGAAVRVETAGLELQRRVRLGGEPMGSQPPVLHFGLAGAAELTLTVEWPSGRTQRFEEVPARQRIRIYEPESG